MRYLGGKFRNSKHIVPLVLRHNPDQIIEPFIGGGSVMLRGIREGYTGTWIAGDLDPDLSAFWTAVVNQGWTPRLEEEPTKEEYDRMRADRSAEPTPLRGFIRSSAAFGGIPWGGYALHLTDSRSNLTPWQSYVKSMSRDAESIAASGATIKIHGGDYRAYEEFLTPQSVVYCDPPYADALGYSKDGFDHETFWGVIRAWSEICPVYVSEYSAPEDFASVFSRAMIHHIKGAGVGSSSVSEKSDQLFTLAGGLGDTALGH